MKKKRKERRTKVNPFLCAHPLFMVKFKQVFSLNKCFQSSSMKGDHLMDDDDDHLLSAPSAHNYMLKVPHSSPNVTINGLVLCYTFQHHQAHSSNFEGS